MVLLFLPGSLDASLDGTTAPTQSPHNILVSLASIAYVPHISNVYLIEPSVSAQDTCNYLKKYPGALHCPPKYPPPHKQPPPHTTKPKPTTTSATPTPTPTGYTQTFYNITAAVQANDYMTFGLVETVQGTTDFYKDFPQLIY
jgi:hypothetical protein